MPSWLHFFFFAFRHGTEWHLHRLESHARSVPGHYIMTEPGRPKIAISAVRRAIWPLRGKIKTNEAVDFMNSIHLRRSGLRYLEMGCAWEQEVSVCKLSIFVYGLAAAHQGHVPLCNSMVLLTA